MTNHDDILNTIAAADMFHYLLKAIGMDKETKTNTINGLAQVAAVNNTTRYFQVQI